MLNTTNAEGLGVELILDELPLFVGVGVLGDNVDVEVVMAKGGVGMEFSLDVPAGVIGDLNGGVAIKFSLEEVGVEFSFEVLAAALGDLGGGVAVEFSLGVITVVIVLEVTAGEIGLAAFDEIGCCSC